MNNNNFKNKFESRLLIENKNKASFKQGGLRTRGILKKENNFLVSIITVTLNSEKHIKETIESVLNQKNKNFEYIIVDGGSSDKTINIIKEYEDKIDYWISETDKGLYDAFNKGLVLARGNVVGFINSDDVYTTECLDIVEKYFKKYYDLDFLFGAVKKHWGLLYGYKPWKIFFSWGFYSSHSTGFFIKLNAAKKVGFYNLKYKYSADYDLFYRMIVKYKMKGVGTKKNEIFGHFRRGGYSSKISFLDHFFEEIRIRLDNGQNKLLVLIVIIFKFLKNIKRI